MSQFQTHYDNLKVARNAPPEVIRAAYKSLSQKFHPDHHQGNDDSTRAFQLIGAAYNVLSDPELRQQHDLWIDQTEAQLRQAAAASRSRRAEDRHGRPAHGQQSSHTLLSVPYVAELSSLLKPSRALAFLTSALLIVVMLVMLLHA
jgi:DnaJ-class molecular chaperone